MKVVWFMLKEIRSKYFLAGIALLGFVVPNTVGIQSVTAQLNENIVPNALMPDTYSARISFIPPADQGTPEQTSSGASRVGDEGERALCSSVVPLVPDTGVGFTSEEQLSLFVYAPEGAATEAKLSVESVDGSEEFDAFVQLPAPGNVGKVALPDTLPALKTGERYFWSLVLMCNGDLRPDSPVVTGVVNKVASVLEAESTVALSMTEKAAVYGEAGLWYDLVTTMAELRMENPGNVQITEDWMSILTSVGLEVVADKPLAG